MTEVRVNEEEFLVREWLDVRWIFAGTVFRRMSLAVLERGFLELLGEELTCTSVDS